MRVNPLLFCFLVVSLFSCEEKQVAQKLIPVSEKALKDTSSLFYANFSSYPKEKKDLAIGVFDSGSGGFVVQEALLTLDEFDNITGKKVADGIPDFAGENFVYLGDYANLPYGDYPAEGRGEYLRELVVKDALFLLGDSFYNLTFDDNPYGKKDRVKIIVMASNSATACGLSDVEQLLNQSGTNVKVIGVIDAAVKATLTSMDGAKNYVIGVIASPATIASGAYQKAIDEIAIERGLSEAVSVVTQSALGLENGVDELSEYVKKGITSPRDDYKGPIIGIEEGDILLQIIERYNFDFSKDEILYYRVNGEYTTIQLNSLENYARFHLVSLVEKHRRSGNRAPLSHIILGCNLTQNIKDVLNQTIDFLRGYKRDGVYIYRNLISKDLVFIDPAHYTAMECYSLLREGNELAFRPMKGQLTPFISVPAYGLDLRYLDENGDLTRKFKFSRPVGTENVTTKVVPFSSRYIDQATQSRLELLVPTSYSLFKDRL